MACEVLHFVARVVDNYKQACQEMGSEHTSGAMVATSLRCCKVDLWALLLAAALFIGRYSNDEAAALSACCCAATLALAMWPCWVFARMLAIVGARWAHICITVSVTQSQLYSLSYAELAKHPVLRAGMHW